MFAAFNCAANISGVKAGVAVLLRILHALALENAYFYHGASFLCKNALKNVEFMSNFKLHADKILQLMNKSITSVHSLQEIKQNIKLDKINKDLKSARYLIELNSTRWCTNYNCLRKIRLNYNYLAVVFMKRSNAKVISDGNMRGRLWTMVEVLKSFAHLFLLHLCKHF